MGLNADFLPDADGMSEDFKNADPASLNNLLERLANDEFDLMGVGRVLIANPEWPQVIREDKAKELKAYEKEMLNTLE